jgi:hypothetical protein
MARKSSKSELPDNLKELVPSTPDVVLPKDIDTYRQLREIDDQSKFLRTVVNTWQKQQNQDREMRKSYAFWLMVGLAIQAAIVNLVFFLIAFGKVEVDPWTARTFIVAVFTEIAALALIVVKYLYQPTSDQIFRFLPRSQKKNRKKPVRSSPKD